MNTAIQDAYDIAWKLGWVLRHRADGEILDSYEGERQPVGRHNVERTAQPDGARQEVQDACPGTCLAGLSTTGFKTGPRRSPLWTFLAMVLRC